MTTTTTTTSVIDAIHAGRIEPGMTFNERVWALTCRVPVGRVTTYRHIAQALQTRAYRAVGQALHRNPHAPAVPCHRVVGSTGKLTGYAGGLEKKKRLLRAEGVPMAGDRVAAEAVVGVELIRRSMT
jgi:methylated-DNA-[protein]-cysteine S-methyltransferase